MNTRHEHAVVTAPASKSISHRALIAAALAQGESLVSHILVSDDIERSRAGLAACGAGFVPDGSGFRVTGVTGRPRGGEDEALVIDVGESGTTCRLLTAVLAAGKGMFQVRGAGRMHERPIGDLTQALEAQGAQVRFLGKPGCPPFLLVAKGLRGGRAEVSMAESSQYLSGLLLAAPMAGQAMTIELAGGLAVSWPYVSLTLEVMRAFGIAFKVELKKGGKWKAVDFRSPSHAVPGAMRFVVQPGPYRPLAYRVEGDWSNASYFLAAGALGPKPVTVVGLRRDSLQGDRRMVAILADMGAKVSFGVEHGIEAVTVAPGELRGVSVNMSSCPDIVPTVAALASRAKGETVISGVAHLRIKESDRLAAVAGELAKTGTRVEVLSDGLRIDPSANALPAETAFSSHGDHRMAMSLSLLGLCGTKPVFDNPSCVAKSYPQFFADWEEVLRFAL